MAGYDVDEEEEPVNRAYGCRNVQAVEGCAYETC